MFHTQIFLTTNSSNKTHLTHRSDIPHIFGGGEEGKEREQTVCPPGLPWPVAVGSLKLFPKWGQFLRSRNIIKENHWNWSHFSFSLFLRKYTRSPFFCCFFSISNIMFFISVMLSVSWSTEEWKNNQLRISIYLRVKAKIPSHLNLIRREPPRSPVAKR